MKVFIYGSWETVHHGDKRKKNDPSVVRAQWEIMHDVPEDQYAPVIAVCYVRGAAEKLCEALGLEIAGVQNPLPRNESYERIMKEPL